MPKIIDPKATRAIEAGFNAGLTPTRTLAEMRALPQFALVAPSLSTVERGFKKLRAADDSAHWTADPDEGGEAASLILPVLAAVAEATDGRRDYLTHAEAQWVLLIRRAAPELDSWPCFVLSREYIVRHAAKEPTGDLDLLLAYRPWSDEGAWRARIERATATPVDLRINELWVALSLRIERFGGRQQPAPPGLSQKALSRLAQGNSPNSEWAQMVIDLADPDLSAEERSAMYARFLDAEGDRRQQQQLPWDEALAAKALGEEDSDG